jgi:hypothetical protein
VTRTFRDGHAETWRAAGARLGWRGPDSARRLVVAGADPGTLPGKATWYLVTSLPRPGGPREPDSPHPAADLAEIVRLYGIRNWTGQGCKQVKDELGWAGFQVRSDIAIRRHQVLVNCAFSFCWAAPPGPPPATPPAADAAGGERGAASGAAAGLVLAPGVARRACLAHPVDRAAALVGRMVHGAPATAAASPDRLGDGRPRPVPLPATLIQRTTVSSPRRAEFRAEARRRALGELRRLTRRPAMFVIPSLSSCRTGPGDGSHLLVRAPYPHV